MKFAILSILFFSISAFSQHEDDFFLLDNMPSSSIQFQSTEPVQVKKSKETVDILEFITKKPYRKLATADLGVLGQSAENTTEYKNKYKRITIEALAGYGIESSTSDLSYYDYDVQVPMVGLSVDFKIAENFQLELAGVNSPSGELDDKNFGGSITSMRKETSKFGLKSNVLVFEKPSSLELEYRYSSFKVPRGAGFRVGNDRSDILLGLNSFNQTTEKYKTTYGLGLGFGLGLSESRTAGGFESGSDFESIEYAFHFGGEVKGQKRNSYIWKLQLDSKKGSFVGEANKVDLLSGQKVKNADLNSQTISVLFGYRWGN